MDMHRPTRFWSRWGIRKQLTAVPVAMVAVPLCVGILVLANLLTNSLSNALMSRSVDVIERTIGEVQAGGIDSLPGDLQLEADYVVQVLDQNGRVVWSSSAREHSPISAMRPEPGQSASEGVVNWWGPEDRNEHRDLVLAKGMDLDGRKYVVLAATSQEDQHSAVTVTVGLLFACVPLVMLVVGLVSWWVGGRALEPVDEMIERVARIRSTTLDQRIPVPEAQDELQSLALTMNQMLERLQEGQASQQRFLSDASHELRSPLASLSGALEIAGHEDSLETWREMAPLMSAEATRLNDLVKDLLTLSRNDDGGLRVNRTELDLDDLAGEEARRLRQATDRTVSTDIHAVRLEADPALLRQVLRNLCDNAARHARSQVRVGVSLAMDPVQPRAVVRVEDDGNGIAPEDRSKVFDRFVRLEESRSRDQGGSGLGLAIVAQIVRAHGGRVRVVDSDLGGACFEVELPLEAGTLA
ncbi:sensor histidine kinase [Luteococcus peritonei]|uniref:histidine kinase n=1 Tax=Luteococcus peritonei TaxID=88874 RepID=A0ABW4RTH1_9ACTN